MVSINDLFVDPNDPETLPPGEPMPTEEPGLDQPEPDQSKPSIVDRFRDLRDRFRPKKSAASELQDAEKKGLEGAKRKVASQTGKEIGKEAEKQVVKQGLKTAVTEGALATGAETGGVSVLVGLAINAGMWVGEKVWKNRNIVVSLIVFFVLLPALAFGLKAVKDGPARTPQNADEKNQVLLAASLAGSSIARDGVTKETIATEKDRAIKIQKNASKYSDATIQAKANQLTPLLNDLEKANNAKDQKTVKDKVGQIFAIIGTLPFGEWVARIAEDDVNQPSQTFCSVTGAKANVGCGSVVSLVLLQAGVPLNDTYASTSGIWFDPSLSTVVDHLPNHQLDPNLIDQSRDKLKRGDVVFWGNGSALKQGRIFDHVGIYVGPSGSVCKDGQDAIANSSKASKVLCGATKRSQIFNGAKRYLATLPQ